MRHHLLILLVLFLFAAGAAAVSADEKGRGHRWVRRHPFTTMALTIIPKSSNPQQYKAANMTTTLAWKERVDLLKGSRQVGLPWHLNLRGVVLRKEGVSDALKARLKGYVADYSGCTGWMVWDEPNRAQMFEAAKAMQWLRKTWPDKLVYSNAFPMGATPARYYGGEPPKEGYSYEQYLRDFSKITGSDVVMYDAYIFKESGTANLFRTMNIVRKVGLDHGKPYWTFVQSYSDNRRGYRMPSESDIRMQVFAHLTSGFSGIAYFTYEDQQGPAMINNATLERRPIYYHVARLNSEVLHVGQALRFLTSTDVRYIPGPGNKIPASTRAWQQNAGNETLIRSITVKVDSEDPVEWRDGLIGFFRNDQGKRYFMLTNLWHGPNRSAADRKLTIRMTFAPTVKSIVRLSRETGQPEQLRVTNGTLDITLPGGTGDLFSLDVAESFDFRKGSE